MRERNSSWARLGAAALGFSALLFAAFPLVRPFYDDLTRDPSSAALTITSRLWVLSHVMLIMALVLLPFGLLNVYADLAFSGVARIAFFGMLFGIAGTGLFLPVGGVEAFALPAIARLYLEGQTADLAAVEAARSGLRATVFAPGLVFLGLAGVCTATAVWRSSSLPRWAGISFALGLVLFLPLLPQIVRVVDGVLIGIGGLWLAWALWQQVSSTAAADVSPVTAELI
jgi:hypothetical protein